MRSLKLDLEYSMVDRLAVLLDQFPVSAQVFQAGTVCGINTVGGDDGLGQLHLVRRGPLEVSHAGTRVMVAEPSLLLYPRPLAHRFRSDPELGADMACANLRFEGGARNPVAAALPAFACLPLAALEGAGPVLALLFEEAFERRCGRQASGASHQEAFQSPCTSSTRSHGGGSGATSVMPPPRPAAVANPAATARHAP
jgi:hypothetical protein